MMWNPKFEEKIGNLMPSLRITSNELQVRFCMNNKKAAKLQFFQLKVMITKCLPRQFYNIFFRKFFMLFLFIWIFRSIIPTKSLKLDFLLLLLHCLHIMWFSSDLTMATFKHMLQKIWHPILEGVRHHPFFVNLRSTFFLRCFFQVSWEAGSAFRPGNNQSVILLEAFEGWNPFPDEPMGNSYNKSSVRNNIVHRIFALINAFLLAKYVTEGLKITNLIHSFKYRINFEKENFPMQ